MLLFLENLEEQCCVAIWDLVIFIWKGISASPISDRGLILIIYCKLKKKKQRQRNNETIEKWVRPGQTLHKETLSRKTNQKLIKQTKKEKQESLAWQWWPTP